MAFACELGDLVTRQKGGKQFIAVDDGVEPLRPSRVDAGSDDKIACLSDSGRLLVFAASEIKAQSSGGRGCGADEPRRRREDVGSNRVQRKGRAGSRHIAAHRAADRGRDRRRRAQNSHRSPRAPGTRIEVQTEAREPREGGGASDSVESQPGCAPPSERPQHSLLLTPVFFSAQAATTKACRATVLQPAPLARFAASPKSDLNSENSA